MHKLYEAWSELKMISSHIPGYQNDCQYFSANLHTFALTKI